MKYKISDICDLNISSITSKDKYETILYLDTSSITNNKIELLQTLSIKEAPSRAKRKVKGNTIIYSTVRPNLKHYGILKNPADNLIVSTGFATIDIKEKFIEDIDAEYLYLLLSNQSVVDYLSTMAESAVSAYPSINPDDIGDLSFNFPGIDLQRKISATVFPLENKIALNTRINAELEAMAKQLYDYWFVQFDFPDENGKPYKSSGGKMVYNEILKREIPEGWEVKTLSSILSFSNGINYEKGIDGDKTYRIINVRNITSSTTFINKSELDIISLPSSLADKYLISEDDIIIARSGTPGSTRLIDKPNDIIYCGFIIKGTPKHKHYKYFLMHYLKQLEGTGATKTGGSILQNVSQETLNSLMTVVPQESRLHLFNETIESLYSLLNSNQTQTNYLTRLRDSLLPMLMNGQVIVE